MMSILIGVTSRYLQARRHVLVDAALAGRLAPE
jgi:hypothetical protein